MDHDLPVCFNYCLYNRNLAVRLNAPQPLSSIRNGDRIPARFQRGLERQ